MDCLTPSAARLSRRTLLVLFYLRAGQGKNKRRTFSISIMMNKADDYAGLHEELSSAAKGFLNPARYRGLSGGAFTSCVCAPLYTSLHISKVPGRSTLEVSGISRRRVLEREIQPVLYPRHPEISLRVFGSGGMRVWVLFVDVKIYRICLLAHSQLMVTPPPTSYFPHVS